MTRPWVTSSIGALLALSATMTRAEATTYCDVPRGADGFIALRAGPSPKARLLHRMVEGDEVLPSSFERKGDWVKVTYWRGGRFRIGKDGREDPHTAIGWMNGKLLDDQRCG